MAKKKNPLPLIHPPPSGLSSPPPAQLVPSSKGLAKSAPARTSPEAKSSVHPQEAPSAVLAATSSVSPTALEITVDLTSPTVVAPPVSVSHPEIAAPMVPLPETAAPMATKLSWTDVVQGQGSKMTKKGTPFLLDSGELCVKIPNEVITRNRRNWDNFIIGQFNGKPPSPGALFAIANAIWSNKARDITVSTLTDKSFLIRIPNPDTRKRVLAQGMWHIDNQSMFVARWEPGLSPIMPELTSAPVWLEFRKVPPQFFNLEGFEYIAGLLGDPKFAHPSTVNMTNLEVAKVFTIVDPTKPLPESINVQFDTGEFHRIEVSSPWLPPTCSHCQEIGHSLRSCPTAPITCSACNSSGHLAEDCSRSKASNKGHSKRWVKKSVSDVTIPSSSKLPDTSEIIKTTEKTIPPLVDSAGKWSTNKIQERSKGIHFKEPLSPRRFANQIQVQGKGKEVVNPPGYNSSDVAGISPGYYSNPSSSDWPSGDDDNLDDDESFIPYVSSKLMRQLKALRKKQSPRGSRPKH